MTIFDEIRDTLRQKFIGRLEPEMINEIENTVYATLGHYDVIEKERHLVVYDNGDAEIIKKFFLAKAIQGCTPRTADTYSSIIQHFMKGVCKHIADITTDDIRIYLAKKKVEKASDSYLATIHRTLSSFFTWCTKEELIQKNPMLRVERIRIRRKVEEPLTEEQLESIRYAARTKREKALIEFLYSTGCRISEAISLNRSDVNFDTCEIDVLGKGRKWRKVYLTQRAKFALQDYLNSRIDKSPALFGYDYSMVPDYLMNDRNMSLKNGLDGRLTVSNAEQIIRKLGRRCGIKIHPHLFRKTVATIALQKGMPIDQVRQMLGHDSIATTTIYAHTRKEEVKSAHEKYV